MKRNLKDERNVSPQRLIQRLNYSSFEGYNIKKQQVSRARNRKFDALANKTALPNLKFHQHDSLTGVHPVGAVSETKKAGMLHEKKTAQRRNYEQKRFKSLLNESNAFGKQSVKNLLQIYSPTENLQFASFVASNPGLLPALSPQYFAGIHDYRMQI